MVLCALCSRVRTLHVGMGFQVVLEVSSDVCQKLDMYPSYYTFGRMGLDGLVVCGWIVSVFQAMVLRVVTCDQFIIRYNHYVITSGDQSIMV